MIQDVFLYIKQNQTFKIKSVDTDIMFTTNTFNLEQVIRCVLIRFVVLDIAMFLALVVK